MKAKATTTVNVHRDADSSDSDGYGDETETAGPAIHSGIPFSIIEKTERAPDPTSGSLVAVTALVGRCGAEHEIKRGDRIEDLSTDPSTWYAVVDTSHPQSPVGILDRRAELRKV